MTLREKFKLDHPVLSDVDVDRIARLDCPHNWIVGMTRPKYCTGPNIEKCKECWDRECTVLNGG